MRLLISLFLLSVCIQLTTSLGELPDAGDNDEFSETSSSEAALILNSGNFRNDGEDVTAVDGSTPPAVVAAPLDPLPEMSAPVARPPGFRPPTSFVPKKNSGEHEEHVNVGFVVRRGRAKVMGFSRRKTESSD
ncbi:hypothetical protein CAEBREN_03886 [Caenorhabditis brenneri]|uniref:Uncharacterized protein n=1 Tax=Caenorhabditis brenneri TaxID=135651 RepID=G0MZG9_CAEBE|nr:hypothetical protein CAEBREN_03886 [Caenorhabditis brenneri]